MTASEHFELALAIVEQSYRRTPIEFEYSPPASAAGSTSVCDLRSQSRGNTMGDDSMDFGKLEALIPRRQLPDDGGAPRSKLFDMLRMLDDLRAEREKLAKSLPGPSQREESLLQHLDEKIKAYEQILE